jgi:hypothetical protein
MINHFWTEFNQKNYKTYPPEDEIVMTSNGHKYYPLCYGWVGTNMEGIVEYAWIDLSSEGDDLLNIMPLPFEPTHWISIDDFKTFVRDHNIDKLLSDGENINLYELISSQ